MLKFLVCLVLVAAVTSENYGLSGLHFDYNTEYAPKYDNYQPRDYHFDYAVSDPHTGDHKSQWEVREKGVVRGGYSLLEPDGTTRIVEYIADDHGFRAVVKKLGTSIHPEHVETHGFHEVAPVIAEAPVPAHVVQQPVQEIVPFYHTYDGQVDNYASVLGAAVKHLEPASYQQPIEIPHTVQFHGYQHQAPVVAHQNQYIANHAPIEEPLSSGYQNHLAPQSLTHGSAEFYQDQPILYNAQELPYESQGQINNLHQINSYPTFSSGQQEHIISHPQAAGLGVLRHHNTEIPITHQGQYYHGVVAQEPIKTIPQGIQESVEYHGLNGNPEDDTPYISYDESGHGHQKLGYYHGEYSQKVHKVVPPPSKSQSHVIDAQSLHPFIIDAGAR